jgi:septum formation protein
VNRAPNPERTNPPQLVLGSASPRRRQLLELLGLQFQIVPSTIDETSRPGEEPRAFALRTARSKALEVAGFHPQASVIGADTVVEIDGRILGKPGCEATALEMLRDLVGRSHFVHTAVALARGTEAHSLVDTATVSMADCDERVLRWYVATGEPLDKAGAYGIQGKAGVLVTGVEGSPHTVVGLPIHRLPELFRRHGLDFWSTLSP